MKPDFPKGPSASWSRKQKATFDRAREVCFHAPWLFMRKDGLAPFYKRKTHGELTIDTHEAYSRMGADTFTHQGIHFVYFQWKRTQLREHPPPMETRLRYLAMPAKYPFAMLRNMYQWAYGEEIDAQELREALVNLWGPPGPGDKFSLQGHQDPMQWTDLGPEFTVPSVAKDARSSGARKRNADDFISLDNSDSDSETVYSSSESETSSFAAVTNAKRARTDEGSESSFSSNNFSVRTDIPPPKALLPTSASIPIRKLLQLLRDRAIAQGKDPGRKSSDYQDLTKPIKPRDGSRRRLRATDYFEPASEDEPMPDAE